MKLGSTALWLVVATVAFGAAPAHALTVWQATPNGGAGAQNFANPDSNSNSQSQSQSSRSEKGWNFEFGGGPRDDPQSRSFTAAPGDPAFRPYRPPVRNPDSPYPLH